MESFFDAIKTGDFDAVKSVLARNASILNARAESGESPLLLAKYYGQAEVLSTILESGYEPNLFEACALGDLDRARNLMDSDPESVHAFSDDGFTPLQLAAYFGYPEIVDALLARDADFAPQSRNQMGVTALHAALAARNPEARRRIVKELVARGADVNAKQAGGFTALQAAQQNGDSDLEQLLRDRGAES
jgi:ankyrin repeat protein